MDLRPALAEAGWAAAAVAVFAAGIVAALTGRLGPSIALLAACLVCVSLSWGAKRRRAGRRGSTGGGVGRRRRQRPE